MKDNEKAKINILLKSMGREDLKSNRLYARKYEVIKEILEFPEWKNSW